MKGIAYCVGVGPGDPELMTAKAIRLIEESDIIAVPGKDAREALAWQIAAATVPAIQDKEPIAIDMPMTRDRAVLAAAHRDGAAALERYLDRGRNVVYLTLGDPTIYCSFSYLQPILEADGYPVELIPGVPSFCAAAARLKFPLAEGDEALHVLPASYVQDALPDGSGTYVLMKAGRHIREVKARLRQSGFDAHAVENCGMAGEKVYRSIEEIPDDAGYFTLIIAADRNPRNP